MSADMIDLQQRQLESEFFALLALRERCQNRHDYHGWLKANAEIEKIGSLDLKPDDPLDP